MIEVTQPRAVRGRAPDVFRPGKSVPMRSYKDDEEVDFAIVGTGAGGGTLACKLAEAGFSVVAFEAGPFWRPLEDFVSDERDQGGLYWTDDRITGGADPIELGSNNSGRGVGGSTVHYTMIALRWRPEWFKCKSTLGYGRDWPISFDELEPYYEEAEEALKISGPISYPWGRRRKRYPYRAHPVNAAGTGARARLRGDRCQMVAPAARDLVGAARHGPPLRLSWLLRLRLLDQRQAERAGYLHSARAEGRRRDPRSRDGRQDRDGQGRARHRPDLSSRRRSGGIRRRGTSSSPATRSRRRGCCSTRNAASFRKGSPMRTGSSART